MEQIIHLPQNRLGHRILTCLAAVIKLFSKDAFKFQKPLCRKAFRDSSNYSISMVPGGLEVTSIITRLTPLTSLMMRLMIF